ncbi:MAG: hypothetical protein M0Q22_09110 [Sulfuritalea sp.]|nr:hypothetical protein [Sulfuritalea sp.]
MPANEIMRRQTAVAARNAPFARRHLGQETASMASAKSRDPQAETRTPRRSGKSLDMDSTTYRYLETIFNVWTVMPVYVDFMMMSTSR